MVRYTMNSDPFNLRYLYW